MIVLGRIIDAKAYGDLVQKWRSRDVRAFSCKVVPNEKGPFIYTDLKILPLESWSTGQPTIVIRYKFSDKPRRLGRG